MGSGQLPIPVRIHIASTQSTFSTLFMPQQAETNPLLPLRSNAEDFNLDYTAGRC